MFLLKDIYLCTQMIYIFLRKDIYYFATMVGCYCPYGRVASCLSAVVVLPPAAP